MKTLCATLILLLLVGCGSSSVKEKPANGDEKPGLFGNIPKPAVKPNGKEKPRAKGIMGKYTKKVVDMHKAMDENPNLTITKPGKDSGGGYLGAISGGYLSAASGAGTIGMKQWVQKIKIVEERTPTYKEFMNVLENETQGFPQMPSYLTYAYDSKTGAIVLLEDKTKQ